MGELPNKITTGSKVLDDMLDGGYENGEPKEDSGWVSDHAGSPSAEAMLLLSSASTH